MAGFLIGFFTVVLVLASLFMVFLVLLQRGSEGGAGSAFGGGLAESAFGGETSKVLTRATVITAIVFFVVGLGLYLGQIAAHKQPKNNLELEKIVATAQANAEKEASAKAASELKPQPGAATAEAMQMLNANENKENLNKAEQTNETVEQTKPEQSTAATTNSQVTEIK